MGNELVEVRNDVWKVRRALSRMVDKQAPFATAVALTRTAKDAQKTLRHDLARQFTIRDHWTEKGIRIRPARKADWPRQVAAVGSRDQYMARQASGGIKRGRGGRRVAVPVRARKRPTSRTKPRQWPGRQLQRSRYFKLKLRAGGVGVFRRYGRGRGDIRLQWWLVKRVKVRKAWPVRDTTADVVRRRFHVHAVRELRRAIHLK